MNVYYFDTAKLQNKNIKILSIPFKINNNYTFDYFDNNKRNIIIKDIIKNINNNNPIIIYALCKTSCASILYTFELEKLIKNKIYLVLFSPLLTLSENNFEDKSGFGKGHSIYNIFKNFDKNNEYENIVKNVFSNKNIRKITFTSELDPTIPKTFNNQIYSNSNNLIKFYFKNMHLHNFFSLFYYGFSKNFQKFRKQNWYIDEKELKIVSKIWDNNINLDKLSEQILNNNFGLYKEYDFIKYCIII